jgi:hypothetical protein
MFNRQRWLKRGRKDCALAGAMSGHPIVVAGIPLPSDAPLFLALLAVHVPTGLICVVAGVAAMLSPKRAGRHPLAGTVYYWALAVVSATMVLLAILRWAEDWPLFVLGVLSFAAAAVGRSARRRLSPGWARPHIAGMGLSYILLLTAFYVDNGRNLPLWRLLPQPAFWVLPSALGLPILAWALCRHPLARRPRLRPSP